MRVEAWDTAFVRARRNDVHRLLADVAGYGRWWPQVFVGRAGEGRSDAAPWPAADCRGPSYRLTFRSARWRAAHRVHAVLTELRADKGLRLTYRGAFDGRAEWYYLDERAGTFVHYLLDARTARLGGRRRLGDHRAVIRAGLHRLKDLLEAGRVIGAEPDAALLDHQRRIRGAIR